jgi:hypothetical protein
VIECLVFEEEAQKIEANEVLGKNKSSSEIWGNRPTNQLCIQQPELKTAKVYGFRVSREQKSSAEQKPQRYVKEHFCIQ